jgi:signal peptidase I
MKRDYKPILKDIISYLLIIVLVVLIRVFIFDPVRVDGPSMENTLLDGQVIILNKIGYKKGEIKRFDIVVADVTINGKEERVVKRVIGLPNDTIYAKDGKVYINDKVIDSSFISSETEDFIPNDFKKIPPDRYFLMGDNRNVSLDSREFGLVKKEDIKGKAVIRIWPLNKIKSLKYKEDK